MLSAEPLSNNKKNFPKKNDKMSTQFSKYRHSCKVLSCWVLSHYQTMKKTSRKKNNKMSTQFSKYCHGFVMLSAEPLSKNKKTSKLMWMASWIFAFEVYGHKTQKDTHDMLDQPYTLKVISLLPSIISSTLIHLLYRVSYFASKISSNIRSKVMEMEWFLSISYYQWDGLRNLQIILYLMNKNMDWKTTSSSESALSPIKIEKFAKELVQLVDRDYNLRIKILWVKSL